MARILHCDKPGVNKKSLNCCDRPMLLNARLSSKRHTVWSVVCRGGGAALIIHTVVSCVTGEGIERLPETGFGGLPKRRRLASKHAANVGMFGGSSVPNDGAAVVSGFVFNIGNE